MDYADNAALIPYDGNDGSGQTIKCLSDREYGNKKDIGISIKNDIYSEEQVVDVNSLADVYIINELLCDADVYWSSFFMSVDFGPGGNKKLRFEAPWDFDSGVFERAYAMIESDKTQYQNAFTRNYRKWNNINNSAFRTE